MRTNCLAVCLILSASVALAGPGDWKQLGKPREWRGVRTGTSIGDKLYTTEKGGGLYVTDGATGSWKAIGQPIFGKTVFLTHSGDTLYSMEKDGSLYSINTTDGSWKQIGEAGAWGATTTGVVHEGKLYTTEVNGGLYVTDLGNGTWKAIGKPEYGATVVLFSSGAKLYSIEKEGSLYEIDPVTGSWKGIGKPGDWRGTTAAAVLDGKLYSTDTRGVLYESDLATGAWKVVGKPEFKDTLVIFPAKSSLLMIGRGGSLYSVEVK